MDKPEELDETEKSTDNLFAKVTTQFCLAS